jgi:hypothetical protein
MDSVVDATLFVLTFSFGLLRADLQPPTSFHGTSILLRIRWTTSSDVTSSASAS